MISFSEVHHSYAGTRVLGPVTGTIPAGGITALIGPNGAGKSTLLMAIGRLLEVDSGEILVGGLNVASTPSALLATQVAILRQENHVSARLTVRELVSFGRFPHSRGRLSAQDREVIGEALRFLSLEELGDRHLDELSGGQRQRAFVAMVLAQDTPYVLLDEPLNNLDLKHSVLMMRQLRAAATQLGRTIVLVIHDINLAAAFADHIIAVQDGHISHSGTVAEIMRAEVLSAVFDTPVRVYTLDGQLHASYTHPDDA